MDFRTARLIPHLNKALADPEDLLNIVAAYEGCHALDAQRFPTVRAFHAEVLEYKQKQQAEQETQV